MIDAPLQGSLVSSNMIMQVIELVGRHYKDYSPSGGERVSLGRWTQQEHQLFLEALSLYGKSWKQVEEHIQTRNGAQIRSHAQKFFNRLERETKMPFNGLKSAQIKQIFEERARLSQQQGTKKAMKDQKAMAKTMMATTTTTTTTTEQVEVTKQQEEADISNRLADPNKMAQNPYIMSQHSNQTNQQTEHAAKIFPFGGGTFKPPYLAQILQGSERNNRKLSDLIDINCDNPNKHKEQPQQPEKARSRKGSFLLCQEQELEKYESLKKAVKHKVNQQENSDSNLE